MRVLLSAAALTPALRDRPQCDAIDVAAQYCHNRKLWGQVQPNLANTAATGSQEKP